MRRLISLTILLIIISCNNKAEKQNYENEIFATYGILTDEFQSLNWMVRQQIDKMIHDDFQNSNNLKVYDSLTSDYFNFLELTKTNIMSDVAFKSQQGYTGDYAQERYVNQYFFDGNSYSKNGNEFINRTNQYRAEILKLVSDERLSNKIQFLLSTRDVQNRSGKKIESLNYYYKDMPLISVIAFISHKQHSILSLELEYLSGNKNK